MSIKQDYTNKGFNCKFTFKNPYKEEIISYEKKVKYNPAFTTTCTILLLTQDNN